MGHKISAIIRLFSNHQMAYIFFRLFLEPWKNKLKQFKDAVSRKANFLTESYLAGQGEFFMTLLDKDENYDACLDHLEEVMSDCKSHLDIQEDLELTTKYLDQVNFSLQRILAKLFRQILESKRKLIYEKKVNAKDAIAKLVEAVEKAITELLINKLKDVSLQESAESLWHELKEDSNQASISTRALFVRHWKCIEESRNCQPLESRVPILKLTYKIESDKELLLIKLLSIHNVEHLQHFRIHLSTSKKPKYQVIN